MNTADRLAQYSLNENEKFSPAIIENITFITERRASFRSYEDYFKWVGMGEPESFRFQGYLPGEVIDLRRIEEDADKTIVYHLPMANPLDPNQLFKIASIAETFPNSRIIAAGNPSSPGHKAGRLMYHHQLEVIEGDFRAVVVPLVKYIAAQGIEVTQQLGGSLGADLALAASTFDAYDTANYVGIEPVSVVKRSLIELGKAFKASEAALKEYIVANDLEIFIKARKKSVRGNSYILGLLRSSNIAIARGMARGTFLDNAKISMDTSNTKMTIAWGSSSELAHDRAVQDIANNLLYIYGKNRVKTIRVEGGKHAMTSDLALQSALIAQALQ